MAGVEVDLAEVGQRFTTDPAGRHELHSTFDLASDGFVALPCRTPGDELPVPLMDPC